MIRIVAVAFIVAIALPAQAAPVAPVHEPDSIITQIVAGCGPGRTRVNGVCVSRVAKRHARRCARWDGSNCLKYY